MGLSNRLLEKTKAGNSGQRAVAWATFGGYAILAISATLFLLLGVSAVVILPLVFLVAQTYEDPSMTVLFVDFCVAIVLFAVISNEHFRLNTVTFFRNFRQKI